jgi:hypothetical protein
LAKCSTKSLPASIARPRVVLLLSEKPSFIFGLYPCITFLINVSTLTMGKTASF